MLFFLLPFRGKIQRGQIARRSHFPSHIPKSERYCPRLYPASATKKEHRPFWSVFFFCYGVLCPSTTDGGGGGLGARPPPGRRNGTRQGEKIRSRRLALPRTSRLRLYFRVGRSYPPPQPYCASLMDATPKNSDVVRLLGFLYPFFTVQIW